MPLNRHKSFERFGDGFPKRGDISQGPKLRVCSTARAREVGFAFQTDSAGIGGALPHRIPASASQLTKDALRTYAQRIEEPYCRDLNPSPIVACFVT